MEPEPKPEPWTIDESDLPPLTPEEWRRRLDALNVGPPEAVTIVGYVIDADPDDVPPWQRDTGSHP